MVKLKKGVKDINMKEKEKYIQFEKLNKEKVPHLFTKKPFDFNKQNVKEEEIKKQYQEIEKILQIKARKIIKPYQTHTSIVKKVEEKDLENTFDNVDGLLTNIKKVALVTSLADCQGILLYDAQKKVIGNIHSGWKGTLNRIVINAIKLMEKEYKSNKEDIEVYICPSICQNCFEVDKDVKDMFEENFKDINITSYIKEKKNKYHIDTLSINKEILLNIGIKEKNITISKICTKCNKDKFHSYRGNREENGRNIAFIMLD